MTSSAASSETGTYLTGLPSAAPSAVATSHLRQPGRVPRAAPRAAARRGATRRQPSADRRLRALPEMSHASLGEADSAEGSLPRSPPHDRYAAAQGRRAASDRAARAAAQDPRLTTEIYGHLDVEDMRAGLDRLRIATPSAPQSAPQPVDPQTGAGFQQCHPNFSPGWCAGGAGHCVIGKEESRLFFEVQGTAAADACADVCSSLFR
jgi:hypothetical protein